MKHALALYREALLAWLTEGGEAPLEQAYSAGRAVAADGKGLLDLVLAHEEAFSELAPLSTPEDQKRRRRAASVLFEALSPFEMALRGYRENNQELARTVTALKRRTAEIEGVNQDLESFSYSLAHDLRAPLRAVDGFTAAALADGAGCIPPESVIHLNRVRAATQRMTLLIDDMLALARLGSGPMNLEAVDLSALADEMCRALAEAAPARQVEVRIEPGLAATGDRRLLRIALENLFANAWKFTARSAEPRVSFRTTAPRVFTVQDNGAGFPPDRAGRLFQPFVRLHSEPEFPGSGVGLATVARVMRRHGGRVWGESPPEGGARFSFWLP